MRSGKEDIQNRRLAITAHGKRAGVIMASVSDTIARSSSRWLRCVQALISVTGLAYGVWAIMAEGPWTIAGTIMAGCVLVISIIGIAITVYAEFIAPTRRKKRRETALGDPALVNFLIPSRGQRGCDFAFQDEVDHLVRRLTLQSHSELIIEVRVQPNVDFSTFAMQFGCAYDEGDEITFENKPKAVAFVEIFTKLGIDRISTPNATPGHRINTHEYYQVDKELTWTVGTARVFGLKVKTYSAGVYVWRVTFFGRELTASKDLEIRVEDVAEIRMTCVVDDHERHQIRPRFRPPAR